MSKEETMEIKKCLNLEELQNFTASNGWLGKWKLSHGVQERKVNCEAGEVPEYTVRTCIKSILELTMCYEPANIWNMDEAGCFLKALPEKGLAEKKIFKQNGVEILKLYWLLLSLLTLLWRKLLNHWSYGEVLNSVASKTLKTVSISVVFTTTLTKKCRRQLKSWLPS